MLDDDVDAVFSVLCVLDTKLDGHSVVQIEYGVVDPKIATASSPSIYSDYATVLDASFVEAKLVHPPILKRSRFC